MREVTISVTLSAEVYRLLEYQVARHEAVTGHPATPEEIARSVMSVALHRMNKTRVAFALRSRKGVLR